MTTTKKGDALADALLPLIGQTTEIRETCAKIARHAATLNRLNEAETSVEMSDRQQARHDADMKRVERLVNDLVYHLPETDHGHFKAVHNGDPRGFAVYIVGPDDEMTALIRGNSFGGWKDGYGV